MLRQFVRSFKQKRIYKDINPEDIFLDSTNLPGFNEHRLEGRMEQPIGSGTFSLLKSFLIVLVILYGGRLGYLQVAKGASYQKISENNRLDKSLIFANRGVIYDRTGMVLASNEIKEGDAAFAGRIYAPMEGLSHVVGYLKYPTKDASGYFYEENYRGQAGVEKMYDATLEGQNGIKLSETDVRGKLVSESVVDKPLDGQALTLSIDASLTQELYKAMKDIAGQRGFTGGAGVIMDVHTGEILALSSFPEFDQNIMTTGQDAAEISRAFTSPEKLFLNRAVSGLYTPGSIVKPIVGLAALETGVISPDKKLLSTGQISLPNPYDPEHPSIFKDWRAQGWINMKDALAVSSDVYFYEVGGGFQDQKGVGISKIDDYFSKFGFEEKTGIDLPAENVGVISTPSWKAAHFDGEDWRVGDTYHTAIGQYGTQVTPLEAVRWVGAIANGGTLLVPSVLKGGKPESERVYRKLDLNPTDLQIIKDGMKQGVDTGIVGALKTPAVSIAAKTGTAELGITKALVNSWSTGFWPTENPHYAFAIIMEKGDRNNTIGGTYVMQEVVNWMIQNKPEYLR